MLSLPGGVFQPYSGVKTSVLVFSQGGATERVLFLHADTDGFKLDAQHDQPIEADDLPGPGRLLSATVRPCGGIGRRATRRRNEPRNGGSPTSPTIRAQDFNLSAGRYRPMTQVAAEHHDPVALLEELRSIETEIIAEAEALIDYLRVTP